MQFLLENRPYFDFTAGLQDLKFCKNGTSLWVQKDFIVIESFFNCILGSLGYKNVILDNLQLFSGEMDEQVAVAIKVGAVCGYMKHPDPENKRELRE